MLEISGYTGITKIFEDAGRRVYRAVKRDVGTAVILKTHAAEYPSLRELSRLRKEYEILSGLMLDGVARPVELIEQKNMIILALEDIDGVTLRERLDSKGRFETGEFLETAAAIVKILGAIHREGVIHKDINPGNIVIEKTNGSIRIIDFGLSSYYSMVIPPEENPDSIEGTLNYISPEQTGRLNRPIDQRTDLYSLGVTFYEMLSGGLPFESDDPLEIIHGHIAKDPPGPNDGIPAPISSIVEKLLKKSPSDRYKTAYGLSHDLTECSRLYKSGNLADFEAGQRDISDRLTPANRLYGREAEIDELSRTFEEVFNGAARLTLVAGFSGIGKSALITGCHKVIGGRGRICCGKFEKLKRNEPYSALVAALNGLIRHKMSEGEAAVSAWRREILDALEPNAGLITELIPEMESVVGRQPKVAAIEPRDAQIRFNHYFHRFISVIAGEGEPLFIFLDDLQWADQASLNLIGEIMTNPKIGWLSITGAYRDNEIDAGHPLQRMIDGLQTGIKQMSVQPLELGAITHLVADTLQTEESKEVLHLSRLLRSKTGGNPFFILSLLHSLYRDGLIRFSYEEGLWGWDIAGIEHAGILEDAAGLIVRNIGRLSGAALEVIKTAACIGKRFSKEELEAVTAIQCGWQLAELLREGLIIWDESGCAFVHDRIQQAAYSTIPEMERKERHLRIARYLLAKGGAVFATADQINEAAELIKDHEERLNAARFVLIAGRKACQSSANESGLAYLTTGIWLLPKDVWSEEYDLALSLYEEAASAAYITSDFVEMGQLAGEVMKNARSILDRIRTYGTLIQAAYAQQRPYESMLLTIEVLGKLGIHIPKDPTKLHILSAVAAIRLRLFGYSDERLCSLPNMTDPHKLAAMRIMGDAAVAVAYYRPEFILLFSREMIRLTLAYGNCEVTPFMYICYSMIQIHVLDEIEAGLKYGRIAMNLQERLGARHLECRVRYVYNLTVSPYEMRYAKIIDLYKDILNIGIETGDSIYVAHAVSVLLEFNSISPIDLLSIKRNYLEYRHTLYRYSNATGRFECELTYLFIARLLGLPDEEIPLCREGYNEDETVSRFKETRLNNSIAKIYFHNIYMKFIFDDYQEALRYCRLLHPEYTVSLVEFYKISFYLLYSLVLLALYPTKDGRQRHIGQIKKNQRYIKRRADYAPFNYLARYLLVEAGLAAVLGRETKAMRLYDKAIDQAREDGIFYIEALANELASKFYKSRGNEKIARMYMVEAHYLYLRWGAITKVRNLEERYPEFFGRSPSEGLRPDKKAYSATAYLGDVKVSSIDLLTLVKTSHITSTVTEKHDYIQRFVKIIMESSGAKRAVLILPDDSGLMIRGIFVEDKMADHYKHPIPLRNYPQLSHMIVNLVMTGGEAVIVNDADSDFSQDAYISKNTVRSVACIPHKQGGGVAGCVYLENNLMQGVFDRDMLTVLNVFVSQLFISIDNFELYDEQRLLSRRILNAQEEERRRLAMEMHDGLGQRLSSLKMSAQLKKADKAIVADIDSIISEMRSITRALRPTYLDRLSIDEILRWYGREFEDKTGIAVHVTAQHADVSLEIKSNLFRIFQEALNNILRHAKASEIDIHLDVSNQALTMTIADDGIGMKHDGFKGQGIGLSTMRDRTRLLGGRFAIDRNEPAGTKMVVEVEMI